MEPSKPKRFSQFCDDNSMSRATGYNLLKLGRGPKLLRIGTRVLVTAEDEIAWQREMVEHPIEGGIRPALRKMAEAS